jgi:hypothetical protein
MFRWYLFYPLAALVAAGVVLISFGPALIPDSGPRWVQGTISQNALALEGEDLSAPRTAANMVYFVPRDANWRASGLRVAVRPGEGGVGAQERGVRILLAPQASEWLGTGPLRVQVTTSPLPLSAAAQLAFGLERGERTDWSAKPIAPIRDTLEFDFPGGQERVRSFALRPVSDSDDANRGVEIRAIRVMRAPTSPAAPAPREEGSAAEL